MVEVLIIAVIYNTYEETLRFLKSIEVQNQPVIKIILVDNSDKISDTYFERKVNNLNLNISYLKCSENIGYFGGADYGLNFYLKNNVLPQWIVVCNVDIVFDEKDFFEKLLAKNFMSDVGIIAPSIISDKWKTDTNPKIISRYTKKKMNFYRTVCSNTFTQNAYMTISYFKKILKSPAAMRRKVSQIIYAPHGSCIIFNENYFKNGGNFKHISFLFGEEIFVAETARRLNLNVLYEPDLKVSPDRGRRGRWTHRSRWH